ncbi:MAG: SpoIIE family protein phosphatase [Oscillospiraceae bacterium]|nr:SpoIIE family protein phosphatase [Oscillospiraceae bacterium]
MRNNTTRRSKTLVWDVGFVTRCKNGETICGDQCVITNGEGERTVVLSDGLGSGVKANILSTLTATMLTRMLEGNVPLDECVTTVAETLPMCKDRKLAYATFTIVQTKDETVTLVQYDNPRAVFLKGGKVQRYSYSAHFIQDKELHESRLQFDVGDMLILFSDGVSEAGRGLTTIAGWPEEEMHAFMERNYQPDLSAQSMAARILSCVQSLDLDVMHDDTTIAVVKLRRRMAANVMIGPPEHKDDDLSTMRLFFAKEGKHVLCGGTTAKAAAKFLGAKVRVLPDTGSEEVPPMSEITGVDLVTEGAVTLAETIRLIELYRTDGLLTLELETRKDGAAKLALLLAEEATDVNILFGNASNSAMDDSDFSFEHKLKLMQELKEKLEAAGKRVKISFV